MEQDKDLQDNQQLQDQLEDLGDGKKYPETLAEGEKMGLTKKQLKRLEKKLNLQKKQQEQAKKAQEKDLEEKKPKGKKIIKGLDFPPELLQQFNRQKIHIVPNKKAPIQGSENILVTSALPYVNNVPHLGNIIGCVLSADVYARFKRLQGSNVLYICGTDEYGTATQVKAMEEKKTPRQICDYYHKIHEQVYEWFDIDFDYFGRTSTEWHTKICQQIFLNINDKKRIKQQQMTQCYCEKCDLFLADRFICGTCPYCYYQQARGDQCDKCQKLFNCPTEMKNYCCSICKNVPILKNTVHFFIDLPKTQDQLEKWIQQSSVKGKWSENSIATTKAWLNQGLKPKCITRDLKWGVPVPLEQFKKKVFYVWFDAPIGYISITANLLGNDYQKWWKNQNNVNLYQFMGKDNIPFHTVIFPSSLIASQMGWTLLHHISTTEYLNYEAGLKFSKRHGTGVFGDSASQTGIPPQVFRYYLLINRPQKSDSEFSWNDFVDRNNNELLANLGNLCHRSLKYAYTNYEKSIPKVTVENLTQLETDFLKKIAERYKKYTQVLNAVEIKEGLKIAMEISHLGNKYLQESKFWEKDKVQSERSKTIVGTILNFIRLLSLLFEPYMPSTSAKINWLLGCETDPRNPQFAKYLNENVKSEGDFIAYLLTLTKTSTGLREPIPLFIEYSEDQMHQWRIQFSGKQN